MNYLPGRERKLSLNARNWPLSWKRLPLAKMEHKATDLIWWTGFATLGVSTQKKNGVQNTNGQWKNYNKTTWPLRAQKRTRRTETYKFTWRWPLGNAMTTVVTKYSVTKLGINGSVTQIDKKPQNQIFLKNLLPLFLNQILKYITDFLVTLTQPPLWGDE